MTIKLVQATIKAERQRQDEKWGTIAQNPHTMGEWLLIIEAELNEAKASWVSNSGNHSALEEIVHIAAVANACLEQHLAIEAGLAEVENV